MASSAMDLPMDWTPGYGATMAQIQAQIVEDQQVDPVAIAVALLAAARQLAPLGCRIGGAILKRMVGNNEAEAEELVNQVDWQEPAQTETPTEDSVLSALQPRNLFDKKLTPEQKEQFRRVKLGLVDCQVKQYEDKRPPRPLDDDDDQLTKQRDLLQQHDHKPDDQELFEGVVANRNLGKAAAHPKGPEPEGAEPDPLAHCWQTDIGNKEKRLERQLKTMSARNATLETEMRRMQKDLDEKNKGQPTPQRNNIATPETHKLHDDCPIGNRHSTAIILAGIIQRHARTPNTTSSSDSSDTAVTTKELYRVANGDDDNGGGGGNDPEGDGHGDTNSMGGDNYGRHTKRHEFMLVKASNITVTTFTGTNLTNNPYLQFYKSMRRLIYSQGGG